MLFNILAEAEEQASAHVTESDAKAAESSEGVEKVAESSEGVEEQKQVAGPFPSPPDASEGEKRQSRDGEVVPTEKLDSKDEIDFQDEAPTQPSIPSIVMEGGPIDVMPTPPQPSLDDQSSQIVCKINLKINVQKHTGIKAILNHCYIAVMFIS